MSERSCSRRDKDKVSFFFKGGAISPLSSKQSNPVQRGETVGITFCNGCSLPDRKVNCNRVQHNQCAKFNKTVGLYKYKMSFMVELLIQFFVSKVRLGC